MRWRFEVGDLLSIQSVISSKRKSLTPAAKRVADVILADPSVVLGHTVSELAHLCATSDPTVVRFCRSVGLRGYAQLRLKMAAELGRESILDEHSLELGSGPEAELSHVVDTVRLAEVRGIDDTLKELDLAVLTAAITAVCSARRIYVYGTGAGTVVAEDLRYKLSSLGLNASRFGNQENAVVGASLLTNRDMAIAFSHAGQSQQLVQFLRMATAAGARTLLVSNQADSPASEHAELFLRTEGRETLFRTAEMASRISQLAVIDCLFVGAAQERYQRSVAALDAEQTDRLPSTFAADPQ